MLDGTFIWRPFFILRHFIARFSPKITGEQEQWGGEFPPDVPLAGCPGRSFLRRSVHCTVVPAEGQLSDFREVRRTEALTQFQRKGTHRLGVDSVGQPGHAGPSGSAGRAAPCGTCQAGRGLSGPCWTHSTEQARVLMLRTGRCTPGA